MEYISPYERTPDDITQRLRAYNLEQVLFNLPAGDCEANERGLSALPGREADFEASVQQALSYAQVLGCRQVHVMAGIPPATADPAACQEVYIHNLRSAADRLQRHGIRLLIEPINTRDMPGYFLNTPFQARQIINTVGSDNLFLQMDLYHCQIMAGDLAENIKAHFDIIGHVQIAGNPARHEPDIGEVHYPYLFDLIDELGYTGWIGCEYRPRHDTLAGLGWAQQYGLGGSADA